MKKTIFGRKAARRGAIFINIARGRGWALLAAGLAAGFINGLLGAGGGVIIVRSAARLLPYDSHTSPRDVYATALAVMLPVSAVSAMAYAGMGVLEGGSGMRYILPAVVGGTVGALLLDRLHTQLLRAVFSAVAVYSGIAMLTKAFSG